MMLLVTIITPSFHRYQIKKRDNGGEVRLSSGAMGSPQLLLLSGIG